MDNNIQNLSSDKIDDVFDLQGLHSKMNAESLKERQEMLSALQEKARRYLPETERTAKYLNALIEYKRLQLGLSVEEYALLQAKKQKNGTVTKSKLLVLNAVRKELRMFLFACAYIAEETKAPVY